MTKHLATFFLITLAPCTLAQAPTKPARLTFDVAVIRPSAPNQQRGAIKPIAGGHGYTAQNISVRVMISLMYKIPVSRIKGGPDWLNNDPYDVEARVDGSYNIDDLHTMFQNLLADRLGLKLHTETNEGNIYSLTIDPAGIKMKPNDTPPNFDIPVTGTPLKLTGIRVPMGYLSWFLGQLLQNDARPVVNQTGLAPDANYDWTLSFQPQLPPGADPANLPAEQRDLPTLFVAVREQLGLNLKAQKGPVDTLVIDSITKPTEN